MESTELQHFHVFSKLSPPLVPTMKEVVKFCSAYASTDGDKSGFDWQGFQAALNRRRETDVILDKFKSTNIPSAETTLAHVANKFAKFLVSVLPIGIEKEELTTKFEMTFTHLESAANKGWADFRKVDGTKGAWEYRILYAVPNPDLNNFFYALITTVKLEASMVDIHDWYNLDRESAKDFNAAITTMELVVMEGFTAPSTAQ